MGYQMGDLEDKKIAVIAGASGLVGMEVLKLLIESDIYDRIRVVTRKKLNLNHDKVKQYIIDFDDPVAYKQLIQGDDLFLCLGTTMKQAGSKEAFYKVDYTYTYEMASHGADNGMRNLFLISAMGANEKSLFYYNRVKGEVEKSISNLKSYQSIHIFRPSLLLGKRKERRKGEEIGAVIGLFFRSMLGSIGANFHPIEVEKVALYMYQTAKNPQQGFHIHLSKKFQLMSN